MSTKIKHARAASPLTLVHHLAGSGCVLQGASNQYRVALLRVYKVLSDALVNRDEPEHDVRRIIMEALSQGVAYELPEFWLLGACNALLSGGVPAASVESLAGVAMFVKTFSACAEAAKYTPNPLPGEVSDEHAAQIAEACGDRVLAIATQAMRNAGPAGGTLQ